MDRNGMYMVKCIVNRFLLLVWFLIWPFTAMVRALDDYVKGRNRRLGFWLFFIFCGLYGYVLNVPYNVDMDLMRHYQAYDVLKELSFNESLPYILSVGDLSYTVFWLLGRFNLPAQAIGFLSAGWFYSSWLLIIAFLYKELSATKNYSVLYLSLLLFICSTYPLFFSGVRSSTGTMLVMLGLLHLFAGNNRKSFLFIILASLFHFSFITFLFLWLIYVTGSPRQYIIWIILLVICSVVYISLMEYMLGIIQRLGFLGEIVSEKIRYYVFEYQNESKYTFVIALGSGWRFIANLLVIATTVFVCQSLVVKSIVRSHKFMGRLEWFIWLFMAFLIFISHNRVMLGRFFTLLVYLCIIYLVSLYILSNSVSIKKLLYVLVFVCGGLSLMGFYRELQAGDVSFVYTWKIFIQNIFSIFSTTINYK